MGEDAGGPRAPELSQRERTALLWWLQSSSKASVARMMRISPHTVDMYIRRVRGKYARVGRPARTKTEMLSRAIEDGLVGPGGLQAVTVSSYSGDRPRTSAWPP